jgi:hypothetical protein
MSYLQDWDDLERDGAVAIPAQEKTAVYQSNGGAVVIRQQSGHDDDIFVAIDPENALRLCRAIILAAELDVQIVPLSEIRIINGAGELLQPFDAKSIEMTREKPLRLSKAKDKTAAARKRAQRQRDKARDSSRDATVTVTHALPPELKRLERVSGKSDPESRCSSSQVINAV